MNPIGRILIADSDENILLAIANLLENEGYECTLALDGPEALQVLEDNVYDLLIAELRLPGNEELELVETLHQYAQGMPVIIYTGHPSLRSAIASIRLSVAAYLIKPVEFSVLLHHVRVSIANYHDSKSYRARNEMKQIDQLTSAIEETIQVLQSTRSSFKSKKLAAIRRKLKGLLECEEPE
jgi:DNA-binding NtrC family response regulator